MPTFLPKAYGHVFVLYCTLRHSILLFFFHKAFGWHLTNAIQCFMKKCFLFVKFYIRWNQRNPLTLYYKISLCLFFLKKSFLSTEILSECLWVEVFYGETSQGDVSSTTLQFIPGPGFQYCLRINRENHNVAMSSDYDSLS